jgi:hypothetical protein
MPATSGNGRQVRLHQVADHLARGLDQLGVPDEVVVDVPVVDHLALVHEFELAADQPGQHLALQDERLPQARDHTLEAQEAGEHGRR